MTNSANEEKKVSHAACFIVAFCFYYAIQMLLLTYLQYCESTGLQKDNKL